MQYTVMHTAAVRYVVLQIRDGHHPTTHKGTNMNKYKCIVMQTTYQTVEIEAKDYEQAETLALEMYDPEVIEHSSLNIYDIYEV